MFSAGTFGFVDDLGRVFRQVHRVLKVGAPLVFSLPHPVAQLIDADSDEALLVRRSYHDRTPYTTRRNGFELTMYPHTFADLYMGLHRSSYRVETVLEPESEPTGTPSPSWREAFRSVPRTLIVKARKEGN